MSFKKLHPTIKEALDHKGFEEPLPFQKEILPKIKGGANVYGIAPRDAGKTTALIISVVHRLKGEAFEDSPRALILVKDKEAALHLQQEFQTYINHTDLRTYCAYEEHAIDKQREEIYYGVDILIATPKRLNKLYFLNSVHLGQLQMFAIEDSEFLIRNNYHSDVLRVTESLHKCQFLIFAETLFPKIERLKETFMYSSQVVKR